MKKIFLGLMACVALCACSSDDLVSLGNETQKVFQGDVAYMTVSIKDVNSSTTRATSPSDTPFAYGSEAEYAVKDAYFYFYDAEGVFVSEAEVWDGGTASTHDETGETPDGNIEFDGKTVIILKGLTQKNYPNYVVTVLNRPNDFTPGETLDEMAALLADASAVGIMQESNTNFTMSTSSYVANASGATDERLAYFATPIPEDAFYTEPIASDLSDITPVDIYVERLAVKVEVGIGAALADNATTYTDSEGVSHSIYKLEETIAGDPNVEDDVEDQEVGDGIGAEDVYVEILGWGLNATAKHSLMMKDIESTDKWTNTSTYTLGFAWNDADNYRSYWGKSFNYGLGYGQYPTTSEGASNESGSTFDGTMLSDYLDYVSYNDLSNTLGKTTTSNGETTTTSGTAEYCAENTNTAIGTTTTGGIISNKSSSAITSVLIAAKVCDEKGNALDLVRYNGELFTVEDYLNYVMNYLTATDKLNVYVQNEDEETYSHIDGSYIELSGTYGTGDDKVTLADGLVAVVVKEDAFSEKTFYYKDEEGGYQEITPADPTVASTVTTALDEFNKDANANAFTGGLMYYNIPIEHLNNNYSEVDDDGMPVIYEANYGVVRNHWYRLTITELENIGTGVYDPDEVIIPSPEVPTYYIGAAIHILSWKLVDQSVTL